MGITLNDLMSRAYRERLKELDALSKELDRAFRRKARLREQYDALVKAHEQIEDAEILPTQNDE